MPVGRNQSTTGNPSSACFNTATIAQPKTASSSWPIPPYHLWEIRQKTNINHGDFRRAQLLAGAVAELLMY
jgi:hypothetical protein